MPYLSVVICTYNRQKFIGACLECLSKQTLDIEQWEAIVVDNNSTDRSAEIVKTFIHQHSDQPIRYVFEGKQGLSFARNRGIDESKGEIVIYIDDDVEVVPEYLHSIYDFFKNHKDAAGMGGRTLPKFSEGPPPPWMSPYVSGITGTTDRGMEMRRFSKRMKYPVGCNMAYRKAILNKVGRFNEALKARADDKYIFEKVAKVNSNIWYVPEAFSLHNIDADRLTDASFERLYTKSGSEEKIKTSNESKLSYLKKALDLTVKLVISVGLWLLYTLKGKAIQGRYIFLSQWYTFKGFFN